MTKAWFLFYGRKLGMNEQEIVDTKYGDMLDMISCFAIYNGAEEKEPPMRWSDVMRLK